MGAEDWVTAKEQEEMFGPADTGRNDASRMLETDKVNRYVDAEGAQLQIACQLLGEVLHAESLKTDINREAVMGERAVDGEAISDFKQVAIEQWQGKLAHAGRRAAENLMQ